MLIPFTGGCLCRAIRYECTSYPVFAGNCHCRDCQRAIGSAFAAALLVPHDAITITGDLKYYDVQGDSRSIVSRCARHAGRGWLGNRRPRRTS